MDLTTNGLRELLNDIFNFLSETLREETLSEHAYLQKEALQSKVGSIISPAYLDMNGTNKGADEVVEEYVDVDPDVSKQKLYNECYEEFPAQQRDTSPSQIEESKSLSTVNYENVSPPFSKLREEATTCGCLYKKEKFLFIDRLNRYWAGIKHDMLLIYNNERDLKPSTTLVIRNYDARPAPYYYTKDSKTRECSFEIVCPGKKTYQFIACSAKDKEQWIAAINDASHKITSVADETDNSRVCDKIPPSSCVTDTEEEYDDVSAVPNENDIYYDISDIFPEFKNKKREMPLPQRPVPVIPEEDPSDSEVVYDDVENLIPDVYYNCPGNIAQPRVQFARKEDKKDQKVEEIEEEIYDDVGVCVDVQNRDRLNLPGTVNHSFNETDFSRDGQASDTNIPSEEYYELIDQSNEVVNKLGNPVLHSRTKFIRY